MELDRLKLNEMANCVLWVERIGSDRWKGRLSHLIRLDAEGSAPTLLLGETAPNLEVAFIILPSVEDLGIG